jgi:glycolate oxidase iron-sulfur subunit
MGDRARWFAGVTAPADDDLATCVACGLCLPHCPTFRVMGREDHSPRGRIAAMRTIAEGRAEVDETFGRMMDECLACRACEAACPSGVPYGRMIEAARAQVEVIRPAPAKGVRRAGLAWALPRRRVTRAMAFGLGVAQALRLDRLAPERMRASTPRVSLRELVTPLGADRGSGPVAALLVGCVMEGAFRPVHRATLEAVAGAGYRAVVPRDNGCCGALAAHYGQPDAARSMARARIRDLERADLVVVNSAGCSAHMKAYGELLHDDPAWAARAEAFSAKVRDVVEMDLRPAPPPSGPLGPVAVHDACHHLHAQGIGPELRRMLTAAGGECREVRDAGRCCGAAGLYAMLEPEMGSELRLQKARAIAETGAPVVAVANPGCAMQIRTGLHEIGADVRVAHPVELLHPSGGATGST